MQVSFSFTRLLLHIALARPIKPGYQHISFRLFFLSFFFFRCSLVSVPYGKGARLPNFRSLSLFNERGAACYLLAAVAIRSLDGATLGAQHPSRLAALSVRHCSSLRPALAGQTMCVCVCVCVPSAFAHHLSLLFSLHSVFSVLSLLFLLSLFGAACLFLSPFWTSPSFSYPLAMVLFCVFVQDVRHSQAEPPGTLWQMTYNRM